MGCNTQPLQPPPEIKILGNFTASFEVEWNEMKSTKFTKLNLVIYDASLGGTVSLPVWYIVLRDHDLP